MRFKHESLMKVKKVLMTRVSYIINLQIRNGEKAVDLSTKYKINPTTISELKLQKVDKMSLDRLITCADKMGLEYSIGITNFNGYKTVDVSLPKYDNDPVIRQIDMKRHQHTGQVSQQSTQAV
ncbi:hypothetical protein PS2_0154 [Aeromonas phage PS2]|nr:hypothetical protein PS2_0154 [Aeromonas phage PS2]